MWWVCKAQHGKNRRLGAGFKAADPAASLPSLQPVHTLIQPQQRPVQPLRPGARAGTHTSPAVPHPAPPAAAQRSSMYVYCPNEQRRLTLTSRAASTMPLFNSLPLSTAAPSMQMPQIAAATSWVRARWLRAPAIWSRPPVTLSTAGGGPSSKQRLLKRICCHQHSCRSVAASLGRWRRWHWRCCRCRLRS